MKRVVVTGLGMVSPVGLDAMSSFNSAVEGVSGVDKITSFDASDLQIQVAAEVKGFDALQYFEAKEAKKTTKFIQYAVAATKQASDMAGLETISNRESIGCCIGVGMGALEEIDKNSRVLDTKGPRRISPFFIPYTIPNMATGVASIASDLQGPSMCATTACASGTHSIGEAFLYIRSGMAKAMVAGGSESTVTKLGISGFSALKALGQNTDDPTKSSRPFDKERNGFVMAEGAGVLVLEDLEHALKRGANIICEMVGYGTSADAHHITAPPERGTGAQRCMKLALDTAGVNTNELNYINAHGTSTKLNDMYESQAVKELFGEHSKSLWVSSTKGVTGHALGAAGGFEGVFTALSLHKQVAPPTAHLENPDEECGLDYLAEGAREGQIKYAMSNSFGFGGTNASILMKNYS